MSNQYNGGNSAQDGFLSNPLGSVRQDIEGQIGQAIDHYASHVPGGERFTPEAKQAVSGVLDGLQRQLEAEAANRLGNAGGIFGGNSAGTPVQPTGNQQQSDNNSLL